MGKSSLPKRNSKNPILGVNRCECGEVRTIHRPKGTRKNFLYSICNECGTNQQTGDAIQAKMRAFFATTEELVDHESQNNIVVNPATEPDRTGHADQHGDGGNLLDSNDDTGTDREPDNRVPAPPSPTKKKKTPWFAVLTGVVVGLATGGAIVRLGN